MDRATSIQYSMPSNSTMRLLQAIGLKTKGDQAMKQFDMMLTLIVDAKWGESH